MQANCGFSLSDRSYSFFVAVLRISQWLLAVYFGFNSDWKMCCWLTDRSCLYWQFHMVLLIVNWLNDMIISISLLLQKHMWLLFCFCCKRRLDSLSLGSIFFGLWNSPGCEYTECNFDLERWIKLCFFFLEKKNITHAWLITSCTEFRKNSYFNCILDHLVR